MMVIFIRVWNKLEENVIRIKLKPTLLIDVDDSIRVKNALAWSRTLIRPMFLFDMYTMSRTNWERLVFNSTLKVDGLSRTGF